MRPGISKDDKSISFNDERHLIWFKRKKVGYFRQLLYIQSLLIM